MIIQDLLLLKPEELSSLRLRYPDMKVSRVRNSSINAADQYLIQLSTDDEEDYYIFLLENFLLMASYNFNARLESDAGFRARMRQRVIS